MNNNSDTTTPHINYRKLVLLILLLAAILRAWGAFDLNEYIEDEISQVQTGISLGTYGTTTGWGWHHPQISGLIMYGTIRIFGDNPVGWRSSNILFGTASVAMIFLIGRLIYPGTAAPILAMALLAFDPHHIYLSRTTFVEIPVIFFFLTFLYLMLEHTENRKRTLIPAGLAMGLTMGTKAYFFFAIPLVLIFSLYRIRQRGELTSRLLVDYLVALLILPFGVYLLSYFKWFSRGYTLLELVQMKMDAVWALKQLTIEHFAHHKGFLEAGGKPWEWFIKPMFWGHQRLMNNEIGIFLIQSNNPPFRLLVLPSLLAASLYALRKRSVRELLVPLLFCSGYLLILMAKRPIFSYSAAALIPFAYLALARTVTLFAIKIHREKMIYACFLFAVIAWSAYMFPIVSARLVPLFIYKPVLSIAGFLGNF